MTPNKDLFISFKPCSGTTDPLMVELGVSPESAIYDIDADDV